MGLGPGREINTFIIGLAAPRIIMRGERDILQKNQEGGYRDVSAAVTAEGPPV